ncbi:hypothetical protein BB31_06320 [Amycolatopsis lurida NRRL 2430]|uniref:Uncharacterized protein n=1 Tax=Amycolatopsis lurida NRRL 2430 TaxID=1460371 RepID=A0A2P2FZ06_AMYLU|nr:hypothetical protein BB31_06320 [Amycolatopsis lurida NRRL 2430]
MFDGSLSRMCDHLVIPKHAEVQDQVHFFRLDQQVRHEICRPDGEVPRVLVKLRRIDTQTTATLIGSNGGA